MGLHQVFYAYIMASRLVALWDSLVCRTSGCLILRPSLGPFPFCFVQLKYVNLFKISLCFYYIILSYCIMLLALRSLFFYSFSACLLSNERKKGSGSTWEGRWGKARRNRGEAIIRVYYVRKKSNFNKRRKRVMVLGYLYKRVP